MSEQAEHPSYAPLDGPDGPGVERPDTYLYRLCDKVVVLCPACARGLRHDGGDVTVLKECDSECIMCDGRSSRAGRDNE